MPSQDYCSITTNLGGKLRLVSNITYEDELGSGLFTARMMCASVDKPLTKVEIKSLNESNATIRIGREKPFYFNGQVLVGPHGQTEIRDNRPFFYYPITLVPAFYFLKFSKHSRQFPKGTVDKVINAVLPAWEITCNVKLTGDLPEREVYIQKDESDYDFLMRITQRDGLTFYFIHGNGTHQMVCTDTNNSYDPLTDYSELSIIRSENPENGIVTDILREYLPFIGGRGLYNFDYEKGEFIKEITKSSDSDNKFVANYVEYCPPESEKFYAQIRMEEEQCKGELYRIGVRCAPLYSGTSFTLKDHSDTDFNQEYLIKSSRITIGIGEGLTWDNIIVNLSAISKETPFRPKRVIPIPKITGIQRAIVVGKEKNKEVDADQYLQVLVRFINWDIYSTDDETSSIRIPVGQPWAGNKRGTCYIPRIGDTVLVAFEDGDPERPFILTSVYDKRNLPPIDPSAEDGTKTVLYASKVIEGTDGALLYGDDNKDKPEIFLGTPPKGIVNINIGGEELNLEVAGKIKAQLKEESFIKTLKPTEFTAEEPVKVLLKKNADVTFEDQVKIAAKKVDIVIEEDLITHVKGQHSEMNEKYVMETKGKYSLGTEEYVISSNGDASFSAKDLSLVGDNCTMKADTKAGITAGGSFVTASSSGVDIKGSAINENSGGSAPSAFKGSVESPSEPEESELPQEEIEDLEENPIKPDVPGEYTFEPLEEEKISIESGTSSAD